MCFLTGNMAAFDMSLPEAVVSPGEVRKLSNVIDITASTVWACKPKQHSEQPQN